MNRIVTTCFGDFYLVGDIATYVGDDDFYYHLPQDEIQMSDQDIQEFFRELKEFEE